MPPTETENPLLRDWTGPFAAPPFAEIDVEHFRPAFDSAIARHSKEVEAIAANPAEPSFDNTIVAMEKSGDTLDRVASVFFNLAGSHTNDAIQEIQREIAPVLARHANEINLNQRLFGRIEALWQNRDARDLDEEQARVLERYHTRFLRAGAGLGPDEKRRLAEINERQATLGTQFGQNVLADENGFVLVLDGEADLAGLPEFVRSDAAQAAKQQRSQQPLLAHGDAPPVSGAGGGRR